MPSSPRICAAAFSVWSCLARKAASSFGESTNAPGIPIPGGWWFLTYYLQGWWSTETSWWSWTLEVENAHHGTLRVITPSSNLGCPVSVAVRLVSGVRSRREQLVVNHLKQSFGCPYSLRGCVCDVTQTMGLYHGTLGLEWFGCCYWNIQHISDDQLPEVHGWPFLESRWCQARLFVPRGNGPLKHVPTGAVVILSLPLSWSWISSTNNALFDSLWYH